MMSWLSLLTIALLIFISHLLNDLIAEVNPA